MNIELISKNLGLVDEIEEVRARSNLAQGQEHHHDRRKQRHEDSADHSNRRRLFAASFRLDGTHPARMYFDSQSEARGLTPAYRRGSSKHQSMNASLCPKSTEQWKQR